jgi:hypothetical protein
MTEVDRRAEAAAAVRARNTCGRVNPPNASIPIRMNSRRQTGPRQNDMDVS